MRYPSHSSFVALLSGYTIPCIQKFTHVANPYNSFNVRREEHDSFLKNMQHTRSISIFYIRTRFSLPVPNLDNELMSVELYLMIIQLYFMFIKLH